ncbi:CCA tRNA nucleotidyltransferase [Pseudogemmobacter sp. W21_MBD1_M6]|uniref:CCA tRNA nucleotidyltransferase n=1 Tax=Pseudogemmobacter sp. W21_MBD1_M6 TaxID=3240271 RepID=UPI003F9C0300
MRKVDGSWLSARATQAVFKMLTESGYKAYAVGGCVRNDLIGVPVDDVDIATDALPDVVTKLAENAGFRAVPTGIDHGTVTVVSSGIPHEITTFRKDVDTDGRHAIVAFSDTIEEDAHRRDFTMNAMYCDADGGVMDPLGGYPDLLARRVRFIDDPEARIKEDYLRILRFFRFHALYGNPDAGLDRDGLAACAMYCGEIVTLSKERVGSEMRKLLSARDPAPSVAAMQHAGVLGQVLPGASARYLPMLVFAENQAGIGPDPIRRLAILGGDDVENGLRLSRAEMRDLTLLTESIGSGRQASELGYRIGFDAAASVLVLRAAMFGRNVEPADLESARYGAQAVCPVSAAHLMPEFQGPELGRKLREIEQIWIASKFSMTLDQLIHKQT